MAWAHLIMHRITGWIVAFAAAFTSAQAEKTTAQRVAQYGDTVRARLAPDFEKAGIAYPPKRLALLGFKEEKRLEVYAADEKGAFVFIRSYPILAASGGPGPKLREGDEQVPEGLYRIELLNPNSRFHLSLRIDYPNAADRAHAIAAGRKNLGGDIMIHGNAVSVGCLAMGDPAAEDLFVLAALTGLPRIQVVLSPVDFRQRKLDSTAQPEWVRRRYDEIAFALTKFPVHVPNP